MLLEFLAQTIGLIQFSADRDGVSEKRSEFRIPLMARVDILWEDESGTPRVAPATLEDTSHRGMSVRMKNTIRAGSHVTVKWGSEQDSGTVTNCRREKSDYILGIQREAGEDNVQN
jgi:hypothetical protein